MCVYLQGAVEPLTKAAALASTGDNRLWARLVAALDLTVDQDKAYVTMLVPTDRVRAVLPAVTLAKWRPAGASADAGGLHAVSAGAWSPKDFAGVVTQQSSTRKMFSSCTSVASAGNVTHCTACNLNCRLLHLFDGCQAVNAFLIEMGLTLDQLLARPVLVDAIVSYHMSEPH
jgi:hypothetical protein